MLCPNCKIELLPATTESKYGEKVSLDQCPDCGGIWCDGEELYLAREVKDENYAGIDVAKLKASTPINQELKCPRDQTVLTKFEDYNFPKSIQIEACPTCNGFWFNRGELLAFQEEREKKIAETKPAVESEFDKSMKELLESEAGSSGYQAMGKLGNFLSMPVDRIDRRFGGGFSNNHMEEEFNQAAGWVGLAGTLIYTLLRLFLKV